MAGAVALQSPGTSTHRRVAHGMMAKQAGGFCGMPCASLPKPDCPQAIRAQPMHHGMPQPQGCTVRSW